jgi:hypothetical protein
MILFKRRSRLKLSNLFFRLFRITKIKHLLPHLSSQNGEIDSIRLNLTHLRLGINLHISIHHSLFCFAVMRSTDLGRLRSCSRCLWKALNKEEGVHGLGFHDNWTCGAKVLEYWMISSLKIKLNCSWKFQRNWSVPLVLLLERSWWARFNGIYLVRFGFRM